MTERFWELLAKKFAGQISKDEKAELEKLLLNNPQYWLKSGMAEQLSYHVSPFLTDEETEEMASKITNRIEYEEWLQPSGKKKRGLKVIAILLSVAIVISIMAVIIFYPSKKSDAIVWKKITTAPGMRASITLTDGSTIWLNAESTLRYPETFNNNKREVFLSGEGYFKIKHDPAKTFIIHTRDMDIRDLGTEFNVRAYPDEDFAETALISGAITVAVHEGKNSQTVSLRPNQKIVVHNADMNNNITATATEEKKAAALSDTMYDNIKLKKLKPVGAVIPETAWKEDKLIFQDEALSSLALRMERWYGVTIIIKNEKLATRHFTGRADNVSLVKLLKVLQEIQPFQYQIKDQEVIIQ